MLPEKLAVDATALISAAIKGRALHIFLEGPIDRFITCTVTFSEAMMMVPAICHKRHWPILEAETILHTLPVEVVDRPHYHSFLREATRRIGGKDRHDVDLLALALFEQAPIWSDDSDFQSPDVEKAVKVFTTEDLFKQWGKTKHHL